jgi:predicted RNA-binding Zn-ribbon protein involved in translation (DUF1610 family)
MMQPKQPNTSCSHCGYKWNYKGKLQKTTCPSCRLNTKARNLLEKCDSCGNPTDYRILDKSHVKERYICTDCAAKQQHTPKPIVNSDGSLATIIHRY